MDTRLDVSYSPSDVITTFPFPESTGHLSQVGKTLNTDRKEIMIRRDLGLTKLYNLVRVQFLSREL